MILYTFSIFNPLPDKWFAKFPHPHFGSCLFTLLMVSSAVQNLLSWMASHWFISYFAACALGVTSKKSLPRPMSRSFPPMFSSRSFVVLSLTVKSLIYFEFIFVTGVR